MLILLIILLLIPFLWLTGFLLVTDFSVPVRDAKQFRRVLVIFPHADDEAIMCGGTLHRLSTRGKMVTLAVLTKGEKGTCTGISRESLKEIRTKEARTVAGVLGISKLIQEDFGDGALHEKKQELKTFFQALIEQEKPDLLLTYDLAGLYGHADHITCSEIITELQKTSFHEIPLWYVTFPKRILARVKPSEYLVTGPDFRAKQALPTQKLFIGASVLPKIRAWYAYKSQRAALKEGTTKLLPFWFFLSMVLFEYFADVD